MRIRAVGKGSDNLTLVQPTLLGRGSIVLGRGGGGSRIHNSISYVRLGRSGDAKTARKAKGYGPTDGPTDGPKTRQNQSQSIWQEQ